MINYYGKGQPRDLRAPLDTITTRDRLALVTVTIQGTPYVIVDIALRMLKPRELYRAQGFPDSYIIDRGHDGRKFTLTAQTRMCGNSVSPLPMAAIARANRMDQRVRFPPPPPDTPQKQPPTGGCFCFSNSPDETRDSLLN
ncbi:DNA cytosine methyltransferase [Halomonas elongata]|uniref:DNA cytosine methyltransferase n=1 Tax=Halomonas elongata TaxID=2746 RepID=UPI002E2CD44A|nr:DNA cytosine methyltransferase [Halomonas elongata]WVI71421.1 DNA cytosine methyltransferase [Halomonas elongata]